jgi:hypothetical protein
MASPDDRPAAGRRRVHPYAITGGRTRPAHDDEEIEALVATTACGGWPPKLTVEQRAIAAASPAGRPPPVVWRDPRAAVSACSRP